MKPEQYDRMWILFEEALGLGRTERVAFLDGKCNGETDLRVELEKLLSRADTATILNPLGRPGPINVKENLLKTDEDALIGRRVGAYQIESQIGAGGMGRVYLARRCEDFEQKVAIKSIRRGMDTDDVLRRFRRERQLLAGLQHPNVARLLDGGTLDDRPYFVMEYIDGPPIDRYCEDRQLGIPDRLRLFLGVCAGVRYAHQNLVLHRDLKPSNILVDATGVPKLLDFGIAKVLDQDRSEAATQTGGGFATPEYAAPEQLRGDALLSTACDLYSLGVILYELLTGRRPHEREGVSVHEMVRRVCEDEPTLPRHWRPDLPRDLEVICLKCLRKEPERRLASVAALSEELERFLAGEPIQSRPIGGIERAVKWVRRRPTFAAVATLAVFALTTLIGTIAWDNHRLNIERQKADESERTVAGMLNQLAGILGDDGRNEAPDISDRQLTILQGIANSILERRDSDAADPGLRAQLGQVLDKTGAKFYLLGKDAAAKTAFENALAIQRRLCRRFPSDASYQHDLAETLHDFSLLARRDRANSESDRMIEEAISLHRTLAETHPDVPIYQIEIARHLHHRADLRKGQWGNSRPTDAELAAVMNDYAEGQMILEEWIGRDSGNRSLKLALAANHHSAGHAQSKANTTEADGRAWDHFAAARGILEELMRLDETVPDYRHELARLHKTMASFSRDRRHSDDGRKFAERAVALEEPLVAQFPAVLKYRFELAGHLTLLGRILGANHPEDAEPIYRRALKLRRQLVHDAPWRANYHADYASLLLIVAKTASDPKQACNWLAEAKDHTAQAIQLDPTNEGYKRLQEEIDHRITQ